MKILIAPDSFKDSLSARKAAECIYDGMKKVFTESLFDLHPIADGGEGTIQAIQNSSVGRKIQVRVHDPLMREIESFFVYLEEEKTAIIEMSLASGLELLKPEERNPWLTTSYGTGELIKAALDTGCLKIIIAIGGSATNDGGAGMAAALGAGFYDLEKHPVIPAGGTLDKIAGVDLSGLDKRINCVSILVACDVTNPLFGPTGASMVYARQKGADSTMAEKLDKNLISFSKLLEEKEEIQNMPGAGAAGGLGFGLVTFLNARIVKGFDLISEITGLEKKIEWADLVITGEGKTDSDALWKNNCWSSQTCKKVQQTCNCHFRCN